MAKKQNHLRVKILEILRDIPETRNSDITLMLEVWKRFFTIFIMTGSSGKQAVLLESLYKIPREDDIKRLRATIQNVEGKFLPTLLSVAIKRRIKEEEWRDYIRTHNQENNPTLELTKPYADN